MHATGKKVDGSRQN